MKERNTYEDWADVERDQANAVASAVSLARSSTLAVAEGKLQVAYLSGPSGIGKSKAIDDAVSAMGAKPIRGNPHNYRDVIEALRQSRGKRPVVFDEADVLFRSDRILNALKIATEGKARQRVYNGASVNAPIFVSTNDDLGDDKLWPRELRPHHQALFNRSAPICIPGGNRADLWEYSVHVAITTPLLWEAQNGDGVPVALRNAALEFFTVNLWRLKVVSPRTLKNIATTMHLFREDSALPHRLNAMLDSNAAATGLIPPIPKVLPRPSAGMVATTAGLEPRQ